jgi:hypothetical protein
LRAEATRAQESADVIRVVVDVELLTDEVDEPSARPQVRAVPGRFRPRDDEARQSLPLLRRELGRPTRCGAGAQPRAALPPVRPLPSTHRAPIDAEALGDDMNRSVALEEFDRAESSPLELSRTPLWAHVAPPTGEHKPTRTLLRQESLN